MVSAATRCVGYIVKYSLAPRIIKCSNKRCVYLFSFGNLFFFIFLVCVLRFVWQSLPSSLPNELANCIPLADQHCQSYCEFFIGRISTVLLVDEQKGGFSRKEKKIVLFYVPQCVPNYPNSFWLLQHFLLRPFCCCVFFLVSAFNVTINQIVLYE